jgi:5-methylthioadenosine/S-adenosylhomocysteine deaminase
VWDTVDGGNALASQIKRAPADGTRARGLLGKQLARNTDTAGHVHAHVALYGSGSASQELELEAKRVADTNGTILNQHQNFMPQQVVVDDRRFGGHALLHLAKIGVLGKNCSFTHMNIVRDDEIDAVVQSGMSLVWQPGNY